MEIDKRPQSAQLQGTNILLLVFAWLLTVVSVGLMFTSFIQLFTATKNFHGGVGATIIFLGLAAGGVSILLNHYKNSKALKQLDFEQRVLSFAKSQSGKALTVPEVAQQCSLQISDTMNVLDRLVKLGACQIDVDERGEMLYDFSCFKAHKRHQLLPDWGDTIADSQTQSINTTTSELQPESDEIS